ncbi:MAG: biopolymer transporter ExbD [Phycisphaerae bacterium]|nr:biopolymer transporter ExbD [Phycisphaerae bacterium]
MRLRTLHRHPDEAHAGKINVTPLIDVVMVLIVFYLIVGQLATQRLADLDLPSTAIGALDQPDRPLVVEVAPGADGSASILADGVPVTADALEDLVRARIAERPDLAVQVRADRRAPYAQVAPVVEACRRAGLASLRLVSVREERR